MPRMDRERTDRLVPITGHAAQPDQVPSGCPFHPRCRYAATPAGAVRPRCRSCARSTPGHLVACHLTAAQRTKIWGELSAGQVREDTREPA